MSTLASPRGPLPARVYWFRRLLVLGLALLVVVGVARLLGGGGDGDDGADTAAQVGSDTAQSEAPSPSATTTPSAAPTAGGAGASAGPTTEPPAEPEGDCAGEDVLVEPQVFRPTEGDTVLIGLDVSTRETAACFFDVSADTLTMSITSGDDDIWSTRQCPAAVPERRAVVRSTDTTRVVVEWSGRRADDECSRATDYALPGFYNVEAAALSGEPTSVQFQLKAPPRPTITRSPEPSAEPTDQPSREPAPGARDGGNGGRRAAPSPSGAVEPDGE